MEIPRFSSMRARNERENKSKKGANYWSTWRKTKGGVRGVEMIGRQTAVWRDREDENNDGEKERETTERGRETGRRDEGEERKEG